MARKIEREAQTFNNNFLALPCGMLYYIFMPTRFSLRLLFQQYASPRFTSRRAALLAAFVFMLLASCTERSRMNPIDPKNPLTAGKPTGLRVIAELDTIQLSWNALAIHDLSGYNVYRQLAHESSFTLLGQTSAATTSFRDVSNRFALSHNYYITARVNDLETPPSEEVTVTPGPTIAWVADRDSRTVFKLSHDGAHEILRSRAFVAPYRLKVDNKRGAIWVLDEFTGELGSIDQKGERLGVYGRYFDAVGLALDEEDGSIWIGDNNDLVLARHAEDGRLQASLDSLPRLGALAFHPTQKELWALTENGEHLLRVERSTMRLTQTALHPSWSGPVYDMAILVQTGEAWIAASNRIARLSAEGSVVFVSPEEYRFASRLTLDQTRAVCWLLNDSGEFRPNSSVFKLDAQGRVLFEIKGLERPQGLAVNPFDGSCYALDTSRGRLLRISAEGVVQEGYANFLTPFDVEVVMPERK